MSRRPFSRNRGRTPQPSGGFTPLTRLADLFAWYRSDLGITTVSGKVSQWDDQSGNGNHLTQGTAANRPTYTASTATFRNLPTLDWPAAGNNVVLSRTTFASGTLANPFTVYAVLQDDHSAADVVFSDPTSVFPYADCNVATVHQYGSGHTVTGELTVGAKKQILAYVVNGATTKIYAMNSSGLVVTASGATESLTGLCLGNGPFGGNGLANGKVAEYVFMRGADSPAQVTQMMGSYLSPRYADESAFVIFIGNSLTEGTGASDPNTTDYVHRVAAQLPGSYGYVKSGHPGEQSPAMLGYALPLQTIAGKAIAASWELTNHIAIGGVDAPTAYAALTTWSAGQRLHGIKTLMMTAIARADAGWTGAMETIRTTVNAQIVANVGGVFDGVVDLAADARLSNPLDTTYFLSDKVHLVDAGYSVVAGLVLPGVMAL